MVRNSWTLHVSHFVVIGGFRLGLGSIAAPARSVAQGTQRMVRNSWTLQLSHFVVIRHIRAHASAAARADFEEPCGSVGCAEIAEPVRFWDREIICGYGK